MSNLRPTTSAARKAILDFARSQVSPSTLKALEIVLSRCCEISATAEVICDPDSPGNYIVTITLSRGLFFGTTTLAVLTNGQVEGDGIIYQDGATKIVFTDQEIAPLTTNITMQIFAATGGQQITESQVDMLESIATIGYVIPNISVTLPVC